MTRRLAAFGITPTELARQLLVPPSCITQIVNGKHGITGDSALRLAHWFGNAPEFWMNLQVQHDLNEAAPKLGTQNKALPARRSGILPKQAQAV
ncbi:HigA family addiction module antitoxin [Nitrogeniibacter aestuarii]|uniref:HigA family addiction module antitoxin n=1 Tax=Nitrogeniibacter aestuarii TaxID=2815343 RepID=UPI0038B6F766